MFGLRDRIVNYFYRKEKREKRDNSKMNKKKRYEDAKSNVRVNIVNKT